MINTNHIDLINDKAIISEIEKIGNKNISLNIKRNRDYLTDENFGSNFRKKDCRNKKINYSNKIIFDEKVRTPIDENINKISDNQKIEDKQDLIQDNYKKEDYQINYVFGTYKINKSFDFNFSVIEDISNLHYFPVVLNSFDIGFVIYMPQVYYTGFPTLDDNLHFPHSLAVMARGVIFYLANIIKNDKSVQRIIICHEHEKINKKCFLQGIISFDEKIKNKIFPGRFAIKYPNPLKQEDVEYLMMFKKSNYFNILEKNKEIINPGDYFRLEFNSKYTLNELLINLRISVDKQEYKMKKITPKNQLLSLPNLDSVTLLNIGRNTKDINLKKYILINFGSILKRSEKINFVEESIDFKWHFPQHAIDYLNNYKNINNPTYNQQSLYEVFNKIKIWFDFYCVNNNPYNFKHLKKGLILYGPRCNGKTIFIKSLCSEDDGNIFDNKNIIYCTNFICWKSILEKKKTAQIIILDRINFLKKEKELIKKLLSGIPIEFHNKRWSRNIPCVIITDNKNAFNYFKESDEFNKNNVIVGTEEYMGPPGTKPELKLDFLIEPCLVKLFEETEKFDYIEEKYKSKNIFH